MLLHKAWLLLISLYTSFPLFACLDTDNIENVTSSGNQPTKFKQNESYLDDAEKEQGYYLKQLFHLYGENDTLTYEGLTLLLKNLGLGKVQVVQIQHTELGHDHVSHLDILDVQDNKHRHMHSTWEHLSVLSSPEEAKPDNEYNLITMDKISDKSQKSNMPHAVTGPEHRKSRAQDRKKANVNQVQTQWKPRDILQHLLHFHHSDHTHQHEDCLNVTQLLLNFGLGWVSEITPQQFTLLCPALLYQIDSRVCIYHSDQLPPQVILSQHSLLKVLGWGALAVTVISAPSLLAVAFIPLLRRPLFRYLLRFLVALAVGTLCGDALLHLLPHAQEDPSEDQHNNESHSLDPVLKGLCVLGGIYLLFLIENLMGLLKQRRKRKKKHPQVKNQSRDEGCNTVLWELGQPVGQGFCEASRPADVCEEYNEEQVGVPETSSRTAHSHHGHSHSASGGGIAEFVWMVLLGDGIHNFTDGLAIGAAFSSSFSGGLSTTIAVLCHELPHELGDFAVLLQTGVQMRKVLFFSLISAFLSYVGMLVGAIASQSSTQVTPWIFAATAGIFLHVALVDMLPQMLNREVGDHCQGTDCFLHSTGFLLGCGIMLCIALFQDQMVFLHL